MVWLNGFFSLSERVKLGSEAIRILEEIRSCRIIVSGNPETGNNLVSVDQGRIL
jgi:hypothetical protein